MTIEKSCFVIMAFGEKKDAEGRIIDFDSVYEDLIKRSLEGKDRVCEGFNVKCTPCVETARTGWEKRAWIHREMIKQMYTSDLVVVDLSTLNPNVFYELGVRHALASAGTILIRREGALIPFNIQDFDTLTYPRVEANPVLLDEFRELFRQDVCTALTVGGVDSLVHETIDVPFQSRGTKVYIGHGHSVVWRKLQEFIQDQLELPWDEFNRIPTAGITTGDRLSEMLGEAAIAFMIMTAEDELADGRHQARMNVIHEAGLFQGRLGFRKAIVILEEGCEEFSNIAGLSHLRFSPNQISDLFEEIRRILKREGLIED